jgi:hypothetical protein
MNICARSIFAGRIDWQENRGDRDGGDAGLPTFPLEDRIDDMSRAYHDAVNRCVWSLGAVHQLRKGGSRCRTCRLRW